jgi:hypothetical protein
MQAKILPSASFVASRHSPPTESLTRLHYSALRASLLARSEPPSRHSTPLRVVVRRRSELQESMQVGNLIDLRIDQVVALRALHLKFSHRKAIHHHFF